MKIFINKKSSSSLNELLEALRLESDLQKRVFAINALNKSNIEKTKIQLQKEVYLLQKKIIKINRK